MHAKHIVILREAQELKVMIGAQSEVGRSGCDEIVRAPTGGDLRMISVGRRG